MTSYSVKKNCSTIDYASEHNITPMDRKYKLPKYDAHTQWPFRVVVDKSSGHRRWQATRPIEYGELIFIETPILFESITGQAMRSNCNYEGTNPDWATDGIAKRPKMVSLGVDGNVDGEDPFPAVYSAIYMALDLIERGTKDPIVLDTKSFVGGHTFMAKSIDKILSGCESAFKQSVQPGVCSQLFVLVRALIDLIVPIKEAGSGGFVGGAVFDLLTYVNESCWPNARVAFGSCSKMNQRLVPGVDQPHAKVFALRRIEQGEEILISKGEVCDLAERENRTKRLAYECRCPVCMTPVDVPNVPWNEIKVSYSHEQEFVLDLPRGYRSNGANKELMTFREWIDNYYPLLSQDVNAFVGMMITKVSCDLNVSVIAEAGEGSKRSMIFRKKNQVIEHSHGHVVHSFLYHSVLKFLNKAHISDSNRRKAVELERDLRTILLVDVFKLCSLSLPVLDIESDWEYEEEAQVSLKSLIVDMKKLAASSPGYYVQFEEYVLHVVAFVYRATHPSIRNGPSFASTRNKMLGLLSVFPPGSIMRCDLTRTHKLESLLFVEGTMCTLNRPTRAHYALMK